MSKIFSDEEKEEVLLKGQYDMAFFAWYFFPHLMGKQMAGFHRQVYKDLLLYDYYACGAPRGHAKSTIGLIINAIHFALYRKVGDITLLSQSEDFVRNEIVRRIKGEFEDNELLIYFFGSMVTDKWSEGYFVLKNGIAFESAGIGGQLRGGRRGLIALDDLESNETCESEDQRKKLEARITKELIPKLLPGGQMVYFGTLIHSLCYLKQILDGGTLNTMDGNGWFKRLYRAYVGEQKEGNELWPSMLPHKELQSRKAKMGSHAFNSEYMNNPVSSEDAPIKDYQIRTWEQLPAQYSCVIAVDPAYSEDAKSDYKVAVVVAIDDKNNRYCLEYIRTRNPSGEFIDGVLNLYLKYKNTLTALGVPCAGTEREFYRTFTSKAEQRKLYPPMVELKNLYVTSTGEAKRGKYQRIVAALQPLFESGKYYIGKDHSELREELLTIKSSIHDDIVDAITYCENLLTPVYFDVNNKNESWDVEQEPVLQKGKSAGYGTEY